MATISPEYVPLSNFGSAIYPQTHKRAIKAVEQTLDFALELSNGRVTNSNYKIEKASEIDRSGRFHLKLIYVDGKQIPIHLINPIRPDGQFCKKSYDLSLEIDKKVLEHLQAIGPSKAKHLVSKTGAKINISYLKEGTVALDYEENLRINGKKIEYKLPNGESAFLSIDKLNSSEIPFLIPNGEDPFEIFICNRHILCNDKAPVPVIKLEDGLPDSIVKSLLTPKFKKYLYSLVSSPQNRRR